VNKEQKKTGKFEQGESGNKAGRPKGSQNKMTRQVKDVINKLLECFTDADIKKLYNKLKDKKPDTLINFLARIAPKDLNVKGEFRKSELSKSINELVKQDNANVG
jgi:hypothetical protein